MLLMILIPIQMIIAMILLFKSLFISIEMPFFSFMLTEFPISLILDWTSMIFMTTVTLISSIILLFSMNYMPKTEHNKFMILMILFVLSMMVLILSDNIIFILLGWDGLGFSSFALVIYYQNNSSAASGTITILSNRVGDILFLLSIGTLMSFSNWNFITCNNLPLMVLIFLMLAGCSKSAQFPFSAWLPAAMAAPTPISALVHSSTLVTAGVFLLIRIMTTPHPITMNFIMILASMTAIYASISANWEQDMKKIIALSTLSQIAMMMFAISLNSTNTAFFHLITHALFKSSMFMCAGIIIHNSHYQDMRHMSSLYMTSPLMFTTLGVSCMALMGIPFMSGFFSKDAIIEASISSKLTSILSLIMVMSVGLTASYSMRMIINSTKFQSNFNPNIAMNNPFYFNTAMMFMMPMSLTIGAMMLWLFLPNQLFYIPNFMKVSIPFSLLMGLLLGASMKFKSTNYSKLGELMLSLMFNHNMTTSPAQKSLPLMSILKNHDNSWQESAGPKGLMNISTKLASHPNTLSITLFFIILLSTLIPLTMM